MTFTPPTADQDADELLQQIVDAIPTLDHISADIRDAVRLRLMQDIAYGVYPAEELAVRYGLGTVAGLRIWLQKNPETMKQIKVMKAMHQSDMALNERLRMKGGHAVEQATIGMAGIAMDPTKDAKIRIEAFKALQRQAGVDGPPPQSKEAATGATFNFTVQFSGAPPLEIKATTVQTIEDAPISDQSEDEGEDE